MTQFPACCSRRARPFALFSSVAALAAGFAQAAPDPRALAADKAAVEQLVSAVSLDVMSEASLNACEDIGAPSASAMRDAWVAWRERHQIAPLRMVVTGMQETPKWDTLIDPMRQRVLGDPAPDQACAALARDWQGAGMDVTALYPLARPTAQALVTLKVVSPPTRPSMAHEAARGEFLLPSQVPALKARHGGWLAVSDEAARRRLGTVYVKGRVAREPSRPHRFFLQQSQGDRHAEQRIHLDVNAEPWVGREIVLSGVVTSLTGESLNLADAAVVTQTAGLLPSPLPQAPMARKEVLQQRIQTAPGGGLAQKDLVAVVVHGQANNVNGTRWEEDVRYLLRDGSFYNRTDVPPDQLDVEASRRLEPQRWGRWRSAGKRYEMQSQDDDARPEGGWKAEQHEPVRPWPKGERLDGRYSRSSFTGSSFFGGLSRTQSIHFTRDGRFERSYYGMSSTGTLQAITGTVIGGSTSGDGKGSSGVGGGTVGTGLGDVGAVSGFRKDDGASRRGRYELDGFTITLHYDDGRRERLLSFPVGEGQRGVYLRDGSYDRDKAQ
ncbi:MULTISPECIES: hypothetical protein [unclassified Roseateles]|uniref:hypothetical protein n=1 Tax=unclassified Roseateles TaxID=2626991 RepID=UPI0006FCFB51|nr:MULTISPECIES: hypothetical protein [unclassified Roseateles]KQW49665.1 hypothetical protein ASC81_25570 [Pelomonas sp. Root405]KRA76124.1 hypothetical protein ASD88_25520 [Pelomonas sp. Root662]